MKKIFFFILFLHTVNAYSLSKNEEMNLFWETYYIHKLANIGPQTKIENIFPNISQKDSESIQKENQKLDPRKLNSSIKVTSPAVNLILLQLHEASFLIDFSRFSEGLLTLNKKVIHLSQNKNFNNFKMEVSSIVNSSRVSLFQFILPMAFAESKVSRFIKEDLSAAVKLLLAAFVTSANNAFHLHETNAFNITETLIYTYQKESEFYLRLAEKTKSPGNFATLTFKCKNQKLTEIQDAYLVYNKKILSDNEKDFYQKLTVNADGTYDFTSRECRAKYSQNGSKISSEGWCLDNPEGLFSKPPFFNFPRVAEACCKKIGCYEKTSDFLKQLSLNHYSYDFRKPTEGAK